MYNSIKAPDFPKGFDWINTKEPLSIEKLRGNIIVLDFWTYCCINCMHILPDLEYIEEKYAGKPVVVIGVHSAKFEEESEKENIEQAVLRYEIKHPVIVDRKMQIWNSYMARGWPTIVVIDPEGRVVYHQSGEGQRERLTDLIDILLENSSEKGSLTKNKIRIESLEAKNKSTLSYPGKLSFSPDKKHFAVSDSNHNRILIIGLDGKIKNTIGSGKKGFSDSNFKSSEFNRPQGVLWLKEGIFIADTENHSIRFIDLEKEKVLTVAGTGRQAIWPSYGGPVKQVDLSSPWDLTERNGLIYIAMAGLHQIWILDTKSSYIRPLAGNSRENIRDGFLAEAEFAQPSGITELNGDLYVADSEVSGIRKIDIMANQVSTISGKGLFDFGLKDGDAKNSLFQHPLGISGNKNLLFIADTYNNAIRQIDLEKEKVLTLIHQKNKICFIGDKECDALGLWEPSDVKYLDRKLYISDTNNHLIRTFDLETRRLETLKLSD